MAGIEKVCEFSGEYPGWEMYGYKRNHIQIMPKYRKEFRGHEAVLYVFEREWIVDLNPGHMSENFSCVNPNPTEEDWDSGKAYRDYRIENGEKVCYQVFFENVQQYKEALKKRGHRLKLEYDYVLYVPSLPGEVDGIYLNWSTDMSSVIRRMKRLVGTRNLTVKYKDGNCHDFIEANLRKETV